jgi:L-serine dehydratase
MGRIVAATNCWLAGIYPVLVHALDSGKYTKEQVAIAMFTASALGLVIANKASISELLGLPS